MSGDRVRAARGMLARMLADTADPRWSSRMLDELLDTVMQTPGGEISDTLQALFELSAGDGGKLTKARANLIQDVIRHAFARFHDSFTRSNVTWARERSGGELTAAQAYLLLYALPDAELKRLRAPILAALEGGPFADEAHSELRDAEA
jgi:hypothetical protein